MIQVRISQKFKESHKKFIRNNLIRTKSVDSALHYLINNPRHPSLNLEKLKGSKYWTIRIDSSNRIFFVWLEKDIVLLVDIGPHDKYRRY